MLHLILRTYSQKMRGKQCRTCNLAHRSIQETHIPLSAPVTLLQCMPSYSTQTTSFRVVMHCAFINMSMSVPSDLCLQLHPSSVSSQSWQWSVALMTRQCKQGSVLYKWFSFLYFCRELSSLTVFSEWGSWVQTYMKKLVLWRDNRGCFFYATK